MNRALRAIETTKLPATTYSGATSALRVAAAELDNFATSEIVQPLVQGALAYFIAARRYGSTDIAAVDPIVSAIRAFQRGMTDFNSNAPHDENGATAYAERSYGPALAMLSGWTYPATTREGALEALRLAISDNNGVYGSQAADRMIQAPIGFLEHYLPSAGPAEQSKANTEITKMFAQWIYARKFSYDHHSQSEHEENYEKYRDLQVHIVGATPHTATDVAIQFFVDTDERDSESSKTFYKRIFALAGIPERYLDRRD